MITHLLGIERDEEFWEWTDTLMYGRVHGISQDAILAAPSNLYGFLGRDDRAAQARAGRRPHLAAAGQGTVDGRPYREHEILDLCFFLLIAGLENTGFGIRATLRHLAVRPDHRAAVLADPSLVNNAGRAVAAPLRARHGAGAHGRVRHRGGRPARSAQASGAAAVRLGQPRRDRLRGRRRVPPRPARRAARRVRHRAAPLRRLAPRAPRDARSRSRSSSRASRTSSWRPGPTRAGTRRAR